jgi:sRNA-binding regulator protein Hfq
MANQPFISLPSEDGRVENPGVPAITPAGPRKLVRPTLSSKLPERRPRARRETPLSSHQAAIGAPGYASSSHAEAFYFQKQMQAQTLMVFVLQDGERIEGAIEWYDTATIKVRNGSVRTLIYKSAIKYLHKAGEGQL